VAFAGQPRVARVTVAPRAHRAEEVIAGNAIVAIARARVAAVVRVESVTRRGSTPRARVSTWADEISIDRRSRGIAHVTLDPSGFEKDPIESKDQQRAFSFRSREFFGYSVS